MCDPECYWWDEDLGNQYYPEDDDDWLPESDLDEILGEDCYEQVCPPGCIPDPAYQQDYDQAWLPEPIACSTPEYQGYPCSPAPCRPPMQRRQMTEGYAARRALSYPSPETPPFVKKPCIPPPNLGGRSRGMGPLPDEALISRFALWGTTRYPDSEPECEEGTPFQVYEDSPLWSLSRCLLELSNANQAAAGSPCAQEDPCTPAAARQPTPTMPGGRMPRRALFGGCEEAEGDEDDLDCRPLSPCPPAYSSALGCPQEDAWTPPTSQAYGLEAPDTLRLRDAMVRRALFESPPRAESSSIQPCEFHTRQSTPMQRIRVRVAKRDLFEDSPPQAEPCLPTPCPPTPCESPIRPSTPMQRIRRRMATRTLFQDSPPECEEEEQQADCLYDAPDNLETQECMQESFYPHQSPCPIEEPCMEEPPCLQETPCLQEPETPYMVERRPARRGLPRWPRIEAARIAAGRHPTERLPCRRPVPYGPVPDPNRSVRSPTPGVTPMTRQRRELRAQMRRSPFTCELQPRKPTNKKLLRI